MHLILAKYWLNTKKHQDNGLDAFLMEGIHLESFLGLHFMVLKINQH
ncbi:phytochrome/two-component sensor histidine kinase [Lacticaseibacillus paracasei]|nr:phytochrome/two-component sensor histidine kinase [Lacticaseibacillus paracasei]